MKRIRLVIARADFENVLRALMDMRCIEPTDPDDFLADKEMENLLAPETAELSKYGANQDSIRLAGTQYTLLLTGWLAARSEQELAARLSNHICAWETEDPPPDERDAAPVKLRWPKITGLFYKGAGKPFSPLASVSGPADNGGVS